MENYKYPKNFYDHVIVSESIFSPNIIDFLKHIAGAIKQNGTLRISNVKPLIGLKPSFMTDPTKARIVERRFRSRIPEEYEVVEYTGRGIVLRKK